jgi:lipopolysaccharide transport system ATP-binding protein
MSDVVIKAENLTKIYKLYKTPKSRLKEALHPLGKKYHREFYALRDINLEITRGESIGILGMNGAGKSTLLKAITGVITPTAGSLQVNGHISALLELGSGFNPEFSGYDNVFFYGALMGFTRAQMKEKIGEIMDFADIGEFIYQPLKTYSSGMKTRLAFAVSTSINPEILILDEVLSVGDAFFQAKCTLRMQNMIKNSNTTVLFVSHDVGSVRAICERCILLEGGRIIMDGPTSDVVSAYLKKQFTSRQKVMDAQMFDPSAEEKKIETQDGVGDNSIFLSKASFNRVSNGKAEFLNVQLMNENREIIEIVDYGQTVILRMVIRTNEDIDSLGFGYHIRDRNSIDVIYGSSAIEGKKLKSCKSGELYFIEWKFKMKILHGNYSIVAVCSIPVDAESGVVDFCDLVQIAYQFQMMPRNESRIYGFVYLDNELTITSQKGIND